MVFTAYVCDDFQMGESRVLTIFGNYAEFTSDDSVMVYDFINNSKYNAVVCPQLYTNGEGLRVSRVIFK